jgi:hypothetical protein
VLDITNPLEPEPDQTVNKRPRRLDNPSSVCTLGKDIAMDRVASLSKRALVEKFYYMKMHKARLTSWLQDFWKPILGYCPRVSLLSNHWYIFHFLSEADL